MKQELHKAILGATYDGGALSLEALIENMEEIKLKFGEETKLTISEFIDLVGMFKDEYKKLGKI